MLIRGTKGSRKVTLTEQGMILGKRVEEILDLVRKTENEITLSDNIILGDVYIGAGETDGTRLLAKTAGFPLIKSSTPLTTVTWFFIRCP